MRRTAVVLAVAGWAGAGGLAGCGVQESDPGAGTSGDPEVTVAPDDDRGSNPGDASFSEISLETSFGYDAAADRAITYFAFRGLAPDGEWTSLWDFKVPDGTAGYELTGRNFAVTLFPRVAPRILDPQEFEVGTSAVLGDKVIALVVDVSGSMDEDADASDPGKGSRLDVAKEVASAFVDVILDQPDDPDRIALVTFATDANILSPLTNDATRLKEMLASLETTGATNFGGALSEAVKAVGIQPGKRAVVFLTDGADTVDDVSGDWPTWQGRQTSLRWQAIENLSEYELVTYAIGFGPAATGADADLRAFANDSPPSPELLPAGYPSGAFYPATTVEELASAFDPGTGIPADIDALPGVRSPYVSFPNDYASQAGPIEARIQLMFENGNGNLTASSLGTFIVP